MPLISHEIQFKELFVYRLILGWGRERLHVTPTLPAENLFLRTAFAQRKLARASAKDRVAADGCSSTMLPL